MTARWALAGTEVHQFSQPIEILMRSTERGLVPATFENGQWRVLARVPSAGTLPGGWEDGFWTDGSGFHVLTKHLSRVRAAPRSPGAEPAAERTRVHGPERTDDPLDSGLRTTAAPMTSSRVFSNSTDIGHFGVDYTAAGIGGWSIGDTRVFRLKETDLAGNESELTRPLLPVPSLIGKTPDQIAALLAPLGFKIGTITTGGTGPAGTVTGPGQPRTRGRGRRDRPRRRTRRRAGRPLPQGHDSAEDQAGEAQEDRGPRAGHARLAGHRAALQPEAREALHLALLGAGRALDRQPPPPRPRCDARACYSIRWTARSGRSTVSRKIAIRFIGPKTRLAQPVRVLLAGPAAGSVRGSSSRGRPKVVMASGVEPTFDAAASRSTDVRVIVVDVNQFGCRDGPRPARSLPRGENRRAGPRPEADGGGAEGGRSDRATALDARAVARAHHSAAVESAGACREAGAHRLGTVTCH